MHLFVYIFVRSFMRLCGCICASSSLAVHLSIFMAPGRSLHGNSWFIIGHHFMLQTTTVIYSSCMLLLLLGYSLASNFGFLLAGTRLCSTCLLGVHGRPAAHPKIACLHLPMHSAWQWVPINTKCFEDPRWSQHKWRQLEYCIVLLGYQWTSWKLSQPVDLGSWPVTHGYSMGHSSFNGFLSVAGIGAATVKNDQLKLSLKGMNG